MKFMKLLIALCLVTVLNACGGLPTPKNANGSISPSVTVAEAKIAYTNAANDATTYVATCHAAPTTLGCNDAIITQVKAANEKAFAAINAAEAAVKQLPANATTGAEKPIAEMNADIAALKSITPKH